MSPGRDWYFALTIILLLAICGYSATIVATAIGVNGGRSAQLASTVARSQSLANEFLKTSTGPALDDLRKAFADVEGQRVNLVSEVNYGNLRVFDINTWQCFFRPTPNCFHRNASESNLLLIALFSGILGASLLFLTNIRTDLQAAEPLLVGSRGFASFICLIPIGAIMGLFALTLMRGTQGALLAPVTSLVQIDNPYGVAFACTVAAFFSDRILTVISKWVDQLGTRQDLKGEK